MCLNLVSTKFAEVFRDIGVAFGSIFIAKSDFNINNYKPLSFQESLNKDREILRKDWEAVGNSLGEYIRK